MDEHRVVTLVCGMCGRTRTMQAAQWEWYKERRAENGSVILCDAAINSSKAKCSGVMDEKSEACESKKMM